MKQHINKKSNKTAKTAGGSARKSYKRPHKDTKEPHITGVVEKTLKGYGFLRIEGVRDEPFIAAKKMNGAMHGDTVEARFISHNKGGGEAEVVGIIKPRDRRVVGTYFKNDGRNDGVLIPDDLRIAREVFIKSGSSLDVRHLEKAVALITDYRNDRALAGEIVEVLGAAEEKGVDILSIIRSYNLYETFPPAVLKEAEKVDVPVTVEQKKGRRDFCGDLIFTIDGDDSKDFDDAVSLSVNDKGNFVLGVHIADVSHYVKAHSALDKEALKRGTSVYFCDRVLPMLPERLSNGICSLNEGVERLTLSCIMEITPSGRIDKHEICEGVIKSASRMTYSAVSKILDGDKELKKQHSKLVPTLKQMQTLASILFEKRKNRGNIDFDLPESNIILDEKGRTVDIQKKPRLIAHRIIEEFMLAANETVAEFMCRKFAPFVYRSHEEPPKEKVEALSEFLAAQGVAFLPYDKKPLPHDFSKLLESVKGEPHELAVSRIALRTMSKACYTPENKGHFGLAAEFYCHFTSPIRRYPDLCIHRIIKDFLQNGERCFNKYKNFTAEAANQSSERERLAEKAERDVDDLKKAEFMKDKTGEKFSGVISGVSEWGVFVELPNTVEGMVKVENLPGDRYEFSPKRHQLSNGTNTYKLGDYIEITIAGVSGLKVEFALI